MIQGKVGPWELEWVSVPHGISGGAHVMVRWTGPGSAPTGWAERRQIEVQWRRDADGVWIELPNGVFGYDVDGAPGDSGGLQFRVGERGGSGAWEGLSFVRAGEELANAADAGKKKAVRVRAQMPGKIVRILVKAGAEVAKDQPLLVMEAMKMENEIRAVAAGAVKEVKVTEGQAVETGADLLILE